ncbi:hypothetical protein GTQ40_07080 [Flavobacteriaceae bacterium R38]|nr:hypothetical protein [Flavobacteriaceae bacterium R38]
MKTQLISLICFLFVFSAIALAQEQEPSIIGKWEGNIVINENKILGILWRFEQSDERKLIGFMGPTSKGIATLPMQDLKVTDSTLNFKIHSEGSYAGKISTTKITGVWTASSGKQLVLNMARGLALKQVQQRFKKTNSGNDIYQSIELGDVDAIKAFLDKGNAINAKYEKGIPLLFYAIKNDRTYQVAKYLLDHGANPNLELEGITPLMYAVAYRNYEIIKELIDHKANINYVGDEKQTALTFAIKGRDKKALQLLIDLGADPDLKIHDNYTAIDLAKEENIREILEVLNIPYEGTSDGPYVVQNGKEYIAVWISKGKKYTKKLNIKRQQTIDYNGMKAVLRPEKPTEVKKLEYSGGFDIAAISDIHGQYKTVIKLLKNNRIIDKDKNWSFGNGHFVITGDVFDRGPRVTEVLWFLYNLEKQAEQAGGKVHLLLGNHDVMVLNGNLRSIHPKYAETSKILGKPFHSLFNDSSVLGNWLRTRPVLIKINDLLFTHGGFHPDLVSKGLSLNQINSKFKKELIAEELPGNRSELGNYLHRRNGPIYYRGYFQGELATTQQIDESLKHFQVSNIIVGHTTHRQIEARYDGKVIVIDANMKSGEMGEILLWKNNKFTRGTLSGKKLPLTIK